VGIVRESAAMITTMLWPPIPRDAVTNFSVVGEETQLFVWRVVVWIYPNVPEYGTF
jgi:hypothetical protein